MTSNLASSGLAFTSSTCIAQGNFSKPDTVLEAIRNAKPTIDGVIVINGKTLSGRIGIAYNRTIVGGVVESTGETGVAAVYQLLLMPFGSYTFRQAVPQDQWQLNQDLNLNLEEVRGFLAGPSSIGLARPADNSFTNLPVVNVPERKPSEEFDKETKTVSINNYKQTTTSTFVVDCNKLLDQVEKRQKTGQFELPKSAARISHTKLKAVQPEKKERPIVQPASIAAVVASLIGFAIVSSLFIGSVNKTATRAATNGNSTAYSVSHNPVADPKPAPKADKPLDLLIKPTNETQINPKPRTIFVLPGQGAVHATPPANTAPPEAESTEPTGNTLEGLLAKNKVVETQNLSFWIQSVKSNPNDPVAREHLAYALLTKGDSKVSIQQFHALMILRKVTPEEIIRYADALSVYDQKEAAQQFLTGILSADPTLEQVRQKLQSL